MNMTVLSCLTSHLPFDRNGMKFFTREGGLEKQDISKILELSEKIYNGEIKPDANKKEV